MLYAPSEEKHPEQRIFTMFLYIVSLFDVVMQYAQTITILVIGCMITGAVGFMIKAQRLTAKDTIYASHVEWIARTISIGSKFLFPIAIIIALYLIYDTTGVEAVRKSLANPNSDDPGAPYIILKNYMDANEDKVNHIINWSITPPIFWWARRCWTGLMRADKHEPIDFPDSFF